MAPTPASSVLEVAFGETRATTGGGNVAAGLMIGTRNNEGFRRKLPGNRKESLLAFQNERDWVGET